MGGFCRRCGEIIRAGDRCSCGGAKRESTTKPLFAPNQTDKWSISYLSKSAPSSSTAPPPTTSKCPPEDDDEPQHEYAHEHAASHELSSTFGSVLDPNDRWGCVACAAPFKREEVIYPHPDAKTDPNVSESFFCRGCFADRFSKGTCKKCKHAVLQDAPFIFHDEGVWHGDCYTCSYCPATTDIVLDIAGAPSCFSCFDTSAYKSAKITPSPHLASIPQFAPPVRPAPSKWGRASGAHSPSPQTSPTRPGSGGGLRAGAERVKREREKSPMVASYDELGEKMRRAGLEVGPVRSATVEDAPTPPLQEPSRASVERERKDDEAKRGKWSALRANWEDKREEEGQQGRKQRPLSAAVTGSPRGAPPFAETTTKADEPTRSRTLSTPAAGGLSRSNAVWLRPAQGATKVEVPSRSRTTSPSRSRTTSATPIGRSTFEHKVEDSAQATSASFPRSRAVSSTAPASQRGDDALKPRPISTSFAPSSPAEPLIRTRPVSTSFTGSNKFDLRPTDRPRPLSTSVVPSSTPPAWTKLRPVDMSMSPPKSTTPLRRLPASRALDESARTPPPPLSIDSGRANASPAPLKVGTPTSPLKDRWPPSPTKTWASSPASYSPTKPYSATKPASYKFPSSARRTPTPSASTPLSSSPPKSSWSSASTPLSSPPKPTWPPTSPAKLSDVPPKYTSSAPIKVATATTPSSPWRKPTNVPKESPALSSPPKSSSSSVFSFSPPKSNWPPSGSSPTKDLPAERPSSPSRGPLPSPPKRPIQSWGPVQSSGPIPQPPAAAAAASISDEKCAGCGLDLGYGELVEMVKDGALRHRDCFRCSGCNERLDGGKHAEAEGKFYHNSCAPAPRRYRSLVVPLIEPVVEEGAEPQASIFADEDDEACASCNKLIGIANAITIPRAKKSFHQQCFTCGACGKSFGVVAGERSFVENEGFPFHSHCAPRPVPPTKPPTTTSPLRGSSSRTVAPPAIRPSLTPRVVIPAASSAPSKAPSIFATRARPPSSLGGLMICAGCSVRATEKETVPGPLSRRYHPKCLKCSGCSRSLDSEARVSDDGVLRCEACRKSEARRSQRSPLAPLP